MNILIVNGSPKGKYSVTLQTCNYLSYKFPELSFDVLHAGQQIKKLEKNFSEALEKLNKADLIIFSYPVYTFIAPCQLHKFIELMKESGVDFSSKFATQITTSKHFYDVTAHKYIEENCKDMHIKVIKGLSADMDDLTKEKGQKDCTEFLKYVLWCMSNNSFEPIHEKTTSFIAKSATAPEASAEKKKGDIVVVADLKPEDTVLKSMVDRFVSVSKIPARVVNIAEYPFKGGCLGCFNCAVSGKCVYKDGFDDFLRGEIQSADAIVYAFTIKDHSMGTTFKTYDDRQFCNGHRTVTMGMPIGYLINGDYESERNLQTIIEGRAEVGGNFLCPVATNEQNPDEAIDRLAKTLDFALENKYVQPANFYGVGGMKIFRDLIYLMQGMMKADHKFYKKHGQYDFPQKQKGRLIAMYLVGALMANPKLKSKMGNAMNEGMLMPYNKILEKAKKESTKVTVTPTEAKISASKSEDVAE